jgi:serine/threonine protein phosphatase PrpC
MLEAYALTDPGRVRSNNQDFFRILPELGLYLLADGMGGARGGERASRLAVECVADALANSQHRDAAALLSAVEEANQKVLLEAARDPRLEGMGTTLVAVLETDPHDLAIASVGDSRAYLFHDNELRSVTEDQTWVQEVGRPLGLNEESLRTHPMRHVLTMAIGVSEQLRVHTYELHPSPGTQILLCSDGLHGVAPEEEVAAILDSKDSLEKKCEQLIAAARAHGGPDNVTAVLLQAL